MFTPPGHWISVSRPIGSGKVSTSRVAPCFTAEATADPTLRAAVIDETLTAPSLQKALGGLNEVLAALPLRVRMERGDMARHLITQVCAERERALADGTPTSRPTWEETATGLVDAIAGLLLAPVTPTG